VAYRVTAQICAKVNCVGNLTQVKLRVVLVR
jgi:hypothetical protein